MVDSNNYSIFFISFWNKKRISSKKSSNGLNFRLTKLFLKFVFDNFSKIPKIRHINRYEIT